MSSLCTRAIAATIVAAFTPAAAALGQASRVTVRGVAYDSLRDAPLAGALVTITGASRSVFTDARGRFYFDSVLPGGYRLEMQHPVLDTVGLSGVTRMVRVSDGREELRLAIPSFATLWTAACGTSRPPGDSGFVYGTIRSAVGGGRVSGAMIDLTWIDVAADKQTGLRQRRWRAQARSDANGDYEVCGVPTELDLRVQATTDSGASGLVDLPPRGLRVQRRDLVIGPRESATIPRGTIAGSVSDSSGKPVVNARVVTDDVPEVRTDSGGRFVVRGVPTGTRQVEALALGMAPSWTTVDVQPGDTVQLTLQLKRITTLDVVRVTASARQRRIVEGIEQRKHAGFGQFLDSTSIGAMGTLTAVFSGMPSVEVVRGRFASQFTLTLPGLSTRRRCVANLYIDGIRQPGFRGDPQSAYDMLASLHTDEIAAVEVYVRSFNTPPEFSALGDPCGAVVVWTKRGIG
jgi:hypothetical protein